MRPEEPVVAGRGPTKTAALTAPLHMLPPDGLPSAEVLCAAAWRWKWEG